MQARVFSRHTQPAQPLPEPQAQQGPLIVGLGDKSFAQIGHEGDGLSLAGTEQDKVNCTFWLKTGSCLYGPECSRRHLIPDASHTVVCRNMFDGVQRVIALPDDESLQDAESLERENELFKEFFEDTHEVFLEFGPLLQYKVCRNKTPHLCGNVYVTYEKLDDAIKCRNALNGRWYGGRPIVCDFAPLVSWKSALCGSFDRESTSQSCSKGPRCNFLHCFINPGGAYAEADLDRHLRKGRGSRSPDRRGDTHRGHSRRTRSRSPRRRSPSPRKRYRSRSPSPDRRHRPLPRHRSRSPPSKRARESRGKESRRYEPDRDRRDKGRDREERREYRDREERREYRDRADRSRPEHSDRV